MITPRRGLFAVVIVLLLCALLNVRLTGYLSRPVKATVHTAQYPAMWLAANAKTDPPIDYSDDSDETLRELKELADRYNEALWEENRKLREQLESFKAISIIIDIDKIRPVEAKVGSYNNDPVNPTMKLLRGTLHGVAVDDAVVYKTNMIGFVTEVGPATCSVSLITKPGYRTEVRIKPPRQVKNEKNWPVFARAQSDGKGGFICDLDKGIANYLREGDIIRVSDALREAANGFVLGSIESIDEHDERPLDTSTLTIKPRAPIGPQRLVTIITARPD